MEAYNLKSTGRGWSPPDNGLVEVQGSWDADREDLARVGKKQVLKRKFGLMSMLGFSCTLLATWEGQLITFEIGFLNGGPGGLVYGYLLVWLGTLSIITTLAELSSIAPTSGGQYHWCAMLAPPSYKKVLSYITGWLSVCGWQAGVVSSAYLAGTMIQGLVILNSPSYSPELWHGALLAWAVLAIAVFFNTIVVRALPTIEGAILILHVVGFFAILIPLVYMAPHGTPKDVFATFLNEGGWSTQGLSFFVGLSGTAFSFLGADGVIHMSEEIKNAAVVVPRAMIGCILLNGVLGFGMLMAVLFCLGDINKILDAPYLYPFVEVFLNATTSVGGSTGMSCILVTLAFCACLASLASSSRMTWAFARDHGLPAWETISKVHPGSSIPLVAVLLTTSIAALLALIACGSSTALNDLISLSINAWYFSYLIPSTLLLWHRLRGTISEPSEATPGVAPSALVIGATDVTSLEHKLHWGPWRLPPIVGIINNIVAVAFMILILFWSFWPSETPVTAENMNYSVLVTGFVAIVSGLYYAFRGRKTYTGPIVEIDMSN